MRMKGGMMNTYNVETSEGEEDDEEFVRQMVLWYRAPS
jgi:uncharacterized protein (DUF305 family)